jgi:hypothetical protein
MPKNYTPINEWNDPPVEIPVTGELLTEAYFDTYYKDFYNRFQHLKEEAEGDDARYDELTENLDNNVGGEVTGTSTPVYTDTTIVASGDSHHTAIEKLDAQAGTNKASAQANALASESNLQKISNIVDKIDPSAADADPFTYLSLNFLVNGDRLKAVVEKFDQYIAGTRRNAEFGFSKSIEAWKRTYVNAGDNVLLYGYDTIYNLTASDPKRDVLTTAAIDIAQQQASGADLYVVWKDPGAGSNITHVLFNWEVSSGGSIEVRFHADDETTWASMEQYDVPQGTYKAVSAAGTDLAIKLKIVGATKLYNFSWIAKGA